MASIRRLSVTRWTAPDPENPGKRVRVSAGTAGAVKTTEKTDHYYIVDKAIQPAARINTGCTSWKAAQAALTAYHQRREDIAAGTVNPLADEQAKPIAVHLGQYLEHLNTRSEKHTDEVKRVLTLATTATPTLKELTHQKITAYLQTASSAVTGNKHRTYLSGFCKWLFRKELLDRNPIDRVDRLVPGDSEPEQRTRRAYTIEELTRLMHTARTYPLATRGEANKGGRPRSDGSKPTVSKPSKLSPATIRKLTLQGQERELMYRLLLATGLRRGELSRVKASMYNGNKFRLPKKILKHKPKHITHVIIPIVPSLAADLTKFLTETGRTGDDKIIKVPCQSNAIREHKARIKMASVIYQTEAGFADIHAMRATMNAYLKKQGVPLDLRQRFLRHTAKDITTARYDPDNRQPMTFSSRKVFDLINALDKTITGK
jgi:integrase